jgi:thiamine kinase-like enzyme
VAQLPLTSDELTAQWLTAVLCEPVDAPPVTAFQVDNANSGTTGRARLRLEYAGATALPWRLFIKLPPDGPLQRAFVTEVGMGRREARFYDQLSAEVPVRVPQCFFAASDQPGARYIMLLEDLAESACTFSNASARYSLGYVREVLGSLARLHGAYWNSPRFQSDLAWVQPPEMHHWGPKLVERALDHYSPEMPPVFRQLGQLYVEQAPAIHQLWIEGTPTLVHGDIHDGNLFYDPGSGGMGAPGLLDWALVGRTSCMRDVAYFLAATPTPEDREAYQSELLAFYTGELAKAGVTPPPAAELWQQYRWHTAYVWVAAVTTLAMGSEWQPVNYVMRTLQRLNRAVEHCACVSALRDAIG